MATMVSYMLDVILSYKNNKEVVWCAQGVTCLPTSWDKLLHKICVIEIIIIGISFLEEHE